MYKIFRDYFFSNKMIKGQRKASVNFLLVFFDKQKLDEAILYSRTNKAFQYCVIYSVDDLCTDRKNYKVFIRFNHSIRLPKSICDKIMVKPGIRSKKKIDQWLKCDEAVKICEYGEFYGKRKTKDQLEAEKNNIKKAKLEEIDEKLILKDANSSESSEKSNENSKNSENI